jgi:hypothetical protein
MYFNRKKYNAIKKALHRNIIIADCAVMDLFIVLSNPPILTSKYPSQNGFWFLEPDFTRNSENHFAMGISIKKHAHTLKPIWFSVLPVPARKSVGLANG